MIKSGKIVPRERVLALQVPWNKDRREDEDIQENYKKKCQGTNTL